MQNFYNHLATIMQSILLIGKSQERRNEYIASFCTKQKISPFDKQLLEPQTASFGIEDIRTMQKTAYLAPSHGLEKCIILNNAQLLTPEAQNALLKILEEPPAHTTFILSATTDATMLPTIVSRCRIQKIERAAQGLDDDRKNKILSQLNKIEKGSIADRLTLAEDLAADKDKLALWFEETTVLARQQMLDNPDDIQIVKAIERLLQAYKIFQTTNVSPRMILEHFLLQ